MSNTLSKIMEKANARNVGIWQIVLENEMELSGSSEDEIFSKLKKHFEIMKHAATSRLNDSKEAQYSLIAGLSKNQNDYSKGESLCGPALNRMMAMAFSCSEENCSMGKICAAPTAGSCGIIPSVIISISEEKGYREEQVLRAMLTASGIGIAIAENATLSGAEGGCQAECGAAAAMAAAAAVELCGGTPEASVNAGAFALMNVLGLVCDPIAGLVQVPCAYRNASQAVNALLSADMALAGNRSPIPFDEVVEAMYKVGKSLPSELRETAMGGIAATKTGRQLADLLLKQND